MSFVTILQNLLTIVAVSHQKDDLLIGVGVRNGSVINCVGWAFLIEGRWLINGEGISGRRRSKFY